MFRVANKKEGIKWPVVINEPRSGGATKEHTIHVYFLIKGQEEIDELVNDGDLALFNSVIDPEKGWEGLTRENDNVEGGAEPIPYSAEELETLLEIPYVKAGFISAYFNFIAGVSSKNSRKRLRTG